MLSVAGADHIITMDLHASQIQVCKCLWNTKHGTRWGTHTKSHTHTCMCAGLLRHPGGQPVRGAGSAQVDKGEHPELEGVRSGLAGRRRRQARHLHRRPPGCRLRAHPQGAQARQRGRPHGARRRCARPLRHPRRRHGRHMRHALSFSFTFFSSFFRSLFCCAMGS